MKINSARGRTAAAAVASAALVSTGVVLASVPAQSAPPAEDCAAPFPVEDLVRGDLVDGLTVSQGTTPAVFTGEILGVINNGIAPQLPMVMAELTSPAIDDVGGIWAGMSGSPVYAQDGRLIGAVAYGLAGTTPVAGITPFEHMDDYLTAPAPPKVRVSDKQARAIARATGVSRAQAARGFRQLPMATSLSGLTPARLKQVKRQGPDVLDLKGVRAGGSVAGLAVPAPGPETLVAGGNLGAALSYGDVTAGGVGTVTSVCNGELVGFGHPMMFQGRTTLGMMPADAVYVQEDRSWVPFKVANMGVPAGTIDQDRLTGITGDIGVLPEETDVRSSVVYDTRNRTFESHSLLSDFNANLTFSQVLSAHDVTIDAIQPGSSMGEVTITGTDADGHAFDLVLSDRYTSQWDIAFESIFDTADLVWLVSGMRGVTVDQVVTDSAVTDETATWRLAGVEQRRGSSWVKVNRRSPALARAGGMLRLRATLVRGAQTQRVPLVVRVPRAARRAGHLEIRGGGSDWSGFGGNAKTPAEVAAALEDHVRNDQVRAVLTFPRRGENLVREDVSDEQSLVVKGRKGATVVVRR